MSPTEQPRPGAASSDSSFATASGRQTRIAFPITAERAHQVGLVNEVVPADQLRERTQQLALSIAANAPLSVLASKRTVYLSAQHPLAAAYDLADEIWEPVYLSDDAQEGPTAFREKRAPQWKGR